MNAVEIEEALSQLAEQPFDAAEFPFAFLEAFDNKATTIKRLRSGASNKSDIGGLLQAKNIHLKVAAEGQVPAALAMLQKSPATAKHKARFVLATDGATLEAEDIASGETVACDYAGFAEHFGFFLPLAGITSVAEIRDNPVDVRATGGLNRLYLELLKENPQWQQEERRHDLNQLMARLIFCFFAESTDIFNSEHLFTQTVKQMSEEDGSNVHEVIAELFRAMDTPLEQRASASLRNWADIFPHVNGGLFEGASEVPRFSKNARGFLIGIGGLDWQRINPDIFGSMIQAVADDAERGALGMHYTSVPNILKVLNPLFLDDLRAALERAGTNRRKLRALRRRMARIRVFDPACGSGNFLVIAYREMRAIENDVIERCGERDRASAIPLKNFRGIELRDFAAEIARLALVIAEYQCDVRYRGQKEALAEFLPLDAMNWITCGNALRTDWLAVCPPSGAGVAMRGDDLLSAPQNQAEVAFDNEGGETYICGNPPYRGSTWQSDEQKADLKQVFEGRAKSWKSLDYVAGWFMKAAEYGERTRTAAAFVATNSVCQGQQVPILWPPIFATGHEIAFAHTSFKWKNLAAHNAGVTVAIVGISNRAGQARMLFSLNDEGKTIAKETANINAYLVAGPDIVVVKSSQPLTEIPSMSFGNKPVDGGHLLMSGAEVDALGLSMEQKDRFVRQVYGSKEFIRGEQRYCLWIEDQHFAQAMEISAIRERVEKVRQKRLASRDKSANEMAARAHQFREMHQGKQHAIVVPRVSSENREFLPVGLVASGAIIGDRNFALYDAPLWNMSLIASRIHLVWVATVCGKLKTDFSYSNTLGWHTFPVPVLTTQNKQDMTHCAEDILLAREAHFPATIADLYDAKKVMPENLRRAHERNDETVERIFIGRRFRNDSERLETLFAHYAKLTTPKPRKT